MVGFPCLKILGFFERCCRSNADEELLKGSVGVQSVEGRRVLRLVWGGIQPYPGAQMLSSWCPNVDDTFLSPQFSDKASNPRAAIAGFRLLAAKKAMCEVSDIRVAQVKL